MQQAIQYIRKLIYHLYLIKHDVVEIFVCYLLLDVLQQIIRITQFLIGTIIEGNLYDMVIWNPLRI